MVLLISCLIGVETCFVRPPFRNAHRKIIADDGRELVDDMSNCNISLNPRCAPHKNPPNISPTVLVADPNIDSLPFPGSHLYLPASCHKHLVRSRWRANVHIVLNTFESF